MPQYRNLGGGWRRDDGTVVPHNGVFTATDREHERIQRRRTTRFTLVAGATAPKPAPQGGNAPKGENDEQAAVTAAPSPEPVEEESTPTPEWTLKTDPATYLERHPDGPNAELARQVLAAQE